MKITAVNFTPYSAAHSRLSVTASSGVSGEWLVENIHIPAAEKLAKAYLVGSDGRATTSLWRRMTEHTVNSLHERKAAAALDVALWDLKAKHGAEPLWKRIGGDKRRGKAHLSFRKLNQSPAQIGAWFSAHTKLFGFQEGKLSISVGDYNSAERIVAMKDNLDASAQQPSLLVSINAPPSPKDTSQALQALERCHDIIAVEAPCPMWDAHGVRRISNSIRGAVMNDKSVYGREGFLPHFRARGLNIIQLSVDTDGITGVLELADAAFGYELPVIIADAPGNIGAHFAGALPYFMSLEVCSPEHKGGFTSCVEIRDGWAIPGDAPGLGLIWPDTNENKGGPQ